MEIAKKNGFLCLNLRKLYIFAVGYTRNYQLVITADGKTEEEIADMMFKYNGW